MSKRGLGWLWLLHVEKVRGVLFHYAFDLGPCIDLGGGNKKHKTLRLKLFSGIIYFLRRPKDKHVVGLVIIWNYMICEKVVTNISSHLFPN